MGIEPLPSGWNTTRALLQGYAHALTVFPRAAAPAHPRWNHVAMEPTGTGWAAAATPLADGTKLESELDLENHRILVRAGDDEMRPDLTDAGSPMGLAHAVARLAEAHGSTIDIDTDRVPDLATAGYDPSAAAAFQASATAAVDAMAVLNSSLDGEVTGPHLWPHGFDIATEWFSQRLVDYDGSPTNAQINLGWYPLEDAYLYSIPWPFEESFAEASLPGDAIWHRAGWDGARWDVRSEISTADVTELGRRVHEVAGRALAGDP